MFRPYSSFEKNLENATSHLRLEPDWPAILLICDAIRQNDVSAKQALQAIKKKMSSPNPHTAYYALLVLESVVKNCGMPVHEEISTRENCEMFSSFIEQTPHENVRSKMLELIQTWAYAFRSSDKYQAIKDTMTILKAKGHNFPELKEADAMFTADTAPNWADGKVCHRCRVEFSFTQRKHHCRNCGQIFCGQCSAKTCPLPKFGIEKEVRVCDGCFSQLQAPTSGGKVAQSEDELPAEYLASSLAQQSQTPPRKTEQELKEEEELQLAIALSQSEAEQKTVADTPYQYYPKSPNTEVTTAVDTTSICSTDEPKSDPELAKYLNRSYWEQRNTTSESPASPSAPSPMPQLCTTATIKDVAGEAEIEEFAKNMKTQVEIFVNRMKSNSSRGRSISNDSSVQTLFMNLTSLHSRLLTYIKDMDDKRMWYEQLQDKLTQIKDSRAALDVLRQEHLDKLRRIAEEHERQRQLQMAHKLEIMRKKKQEYLQYQRQLALQRIHEQEREMQMRQEQQKAQYRIGQTVFPFVPSQQNSPSHQLPAPYGSYGYNPNQGNLPRLVPQEQILTNQQKQPGITSIPMPGMYNPALLVVSNQGHLMGPGGQMHAINSTQPQATAPIQQGSIQTTHQVNALSGPDGVTSSGLPHSSIVTSAMQHGVIPQGGAFVPNQTQLVQNTMVSNTPTANIPIQGPIPITSVNQQILSSAPNQNNMQSQPNPVEQPSINDVTSLKHSINAPSEQKNEEKAEVNTAELISFD